MSKYLKFSLKALAILMSGILFGLAGLEVHDRIYPKYSMIEGSRPFNNPQLVAEVEQIKPQVGPKMENPSPRAELPVMILHKENTLVFNEVVTDESVAKFLVKAQEMSNKLPESQEIILVLYTPGGSVDAGMQMIDAMKAFPQKVKTLTLFSASMGFQIVQNMDERMITPSGVLMSHRAKGGFEGEIGGELDVQLNAARRQIQFLDQIAADRMGMTLEKYRELIRDEYWLHGFESVEDRGADKLILARCGKDMTGTEDKEFDVLFFKIKATFSKCPLITAPLDVKIAESAQSKPEDYVRVRQILAMIYNNPKDFVKNYIVTSEWQPYFVNSKK